MVELLLLLLAVFLVAANAVFVAAEFSLVTVDRATVEREAAGDPRTRGVNQALRTLSTQLSGAQLGITLASLIIGFIAEPSIAVLIDGPLESAGVPVSAVGGVSIALALLLATAFQMVLGELVPKNLAITHPLAVARRVAGPQRLFTSMSRWTIALLNGTSNRCLRLMGIEPQEELNTARSAAELSSVVDRSRDQGTLDAHTAGLLSRSLRFGDRRAADVMTPRVRVQAVEASAPVSEVIKAVERRGHSRFPVVNGDLDRLCGMVHVKHALAVPAEARSSVTVAEVMIEPLAVPFSVRLEPLLVMLRNDVSQMALVINEYGGTDGIVTLEDLVEELVGEISDEFDRVGTRARHRRDGSWTVSGTLRPDEVFELTGIRIPESDTWDTIAGFMMARLGEVPAVGMMVEEVTVSIPEASRQRVLLTVERMDNQRIDRLSVECVLQRVDDGTEVTR